MQKRLVVGVLLSVMLVGFTGCPATQVSPGTWLFDIGSDNTFFTASRALDLLGDGSTQDTDPIPPNTTPFTGTLTWMQNDGTFTMSQVVSGAGGGYTGTINSRTSMDGTWVSNFLETGTWSAEKL